MKKKFPKFQDLAFCLLSLPYTMVWTTFHGGTESESNDFKKWYVLAHEKACLYVFSTNVVGFKSRKGPTVFSR